MRVLKIWDYFCYSPEWNEPIPYNHKLFNESYFLENGPSSRLYKRSFYDSAKKYRGNSFTRWCENKLPKDHNPKKRKFIKTTPLLIGGSPPNSEEVIDECLKQMMKDFGLNDKSKNDILKLDSKFKWHIYCTYRQEKCDLMYLARSYVNLLKEFKEYLLKSTSAIQLELISKTFGLLNSLMIDLRCKPPFFIRELIGLSIVDLIFNLINSLAYRYLSWTNTYSVQNLERSHTTMNTFHDNSICWQILMVQYLIQCLKHVTCSTEKLDKMFNNPSHIELLIALLNDVIFLSDEFSTGTSESAKAGIITSTNNTLYTNAHNSFGSDIEPLSISLSFDAIFEKFEDKTHKIMPQTNNGYTQKLSSDSDYLKFQNSFYSFNCTLRTKALIYDIINYMIYLPYYKRTVLKCFGKIRISLKYSSRFQKIMWDLSNLLRQYRLKYSSKLEHFSATTNNHSEMNNGSCFPADDNTYKHKKDTNNTKAPKIIINNSTTKRLKNSISNLNIGSLNLISSITSSLPKISPFKRLGTLFSNFSPFSFTISPFDRSVFISFNFNDPNDSDFKKCRSVFKTPKMSFNSKDVITQPDNCSYTNHGLSLQDKNLDHPVVNAYDNTNMTDDKNLQKSGDKFHIDNSESLAVIEFVASMLAFINVMIDYSFDRKALEYRLHMRKEFTDLGLLDIIEMIETIQEDDIITKHLKFFTDLKRFDDHIVFESYNNIPSNEGRIDQLFDNLNHILEPTPSYNYFESFLYHAVLISKQENVDKVKTSWKNVDLFIQQLSAQNFAIELDKSVFQIDQNKLQNSSTKHDEIKRRDDKLIKELEQRSDGYRRELATLKMELEHYIINNDEMKKHLNALKREYDKEILNRIYVQKSLPEHKAERNCNYNNNIDSDFLTNDYSKNLSEEAIFSKTKNDAEHQKTPLLHHNLLSKECESVKIVNSMPSPPKAPPLPINLESEPMNKKCKNIPAPSLPMKSLNWKVLPIKNVEGTIWELMNEFSIYEQIDMEEFEKLFSAYQKTQQLNEDMVLQNIYNNNDLTSPKTSIIPGAPSLSLIESRRAQNCTILLSKLKTNYVQLTNNILNLDPNNELHKDMYDQLLRFIPTLEEISILNEHSNEVHNFAKADLFLYQMSKIYRYEQKLRYLCFKKKFKGKLQELEQNIITYNMACEEILSECTNIYFPLNQEQKCNPKILKTILELTLALGNYMNRGNRKNIWAYSLDSLNNLNDTKSSFNSNLTLLHYTVGILEKIVDPETLEFHVVPLWSVLEKNLNHIKPASKINLTELELDMKKLGKGLLDIKQEIKIHSEAFKKEPNLLDIRDTFIPTMTDFITTSEGLFFRTKHMFEDMKIMLNKVLVLFAIRDDIHTDLNASKNKQDSAINIFESLDNFIVSFKEASLDLNKYLLTNSKKESIIIRPLNFVEKLEPTKKEDMVTQKVKSRSSKSSDLNINPYNLNSGYELEKVNKTGQNKWFFKKEQMENRKFKELIEVLQSSGN
ncbi:unnamed protein product [Gordionus sp. m RMFG-2023]